MEKLKGYRVMLGLTQKKMADQLSISLQSYNNKELGKTPFNDKERLLIKSMVTKIKPDITIDELFYSWKTGNKKALTVGKLIRLLTINTKTQDSRQAVKVLGNFIYLNYTISWYRAQKVVQEVHKMETEKTELELTELELTELELTELELEKFLEEVEKVHAQLRFNKIVQEMKENDPNLYQILFDFLHKKLSLDELNDFLSLEGEARRAYIDSYQARWGDLKWLMIY